MASVAEEIIAAMTPAEIDPGAYLLAYDEAKRALDEQERAVFELRSRAGQLIAGAAIATSFFGGQALRHHLHPVGWIAVGCFVAEVIAWVIVLINQS